MKLDYYLGRPFESVIQNEDGEKWEWGIQLEGGVTIRNLDSDRTTVPDESVFAGTSFLAVNFTDEETTLKFGHSGPEGVRYVGEIELTPALYSLADDEYTRGEEVFPGVEQAVTSNLPPDPSSERVAEAPEPSADGLESPEAAE